MFDKKNRYRIKCLKWHQRIRIELSSWLELIQLLPTIIRAVKKNG